MAFDPGAPVPPKPPRFPVPPLPPGFTPPRAAALPEPSPGGMMEFLQKRLETLEAELVAERDCSRVAAARLDHQDKLRAESEELLHSLTERLRREKGEMESRERQSHDKGRIEALEKRLDEMQQSWTSLLKESLAPPQAKDERIAGLDRENRELMKALKERSLSLEAYARERGEIERSLGESLTRLSRELLAERDKNRAAPLRISELENEASLLREKLEYQTRVGRLQDERMAEAAERHEATSRLLLLEAQKATEVLQARRLSEEAANARIAETGKALEAQSQERLREADLNRQLRAQVAALTQQLTEALQQRDALKAQYSSWEEDRSKILDSLKKKEDMVTLLSSTFQNIIRNQPKSAE